MVTPKVDTMKISLCFNESWRKGLKKYTAIGKIAVKRVDAISPQAITVSQKLVEIEYFFLSNQRINVKTSNALLKESLLTATSHQYAGDKNSRNRKKKDFR